jgi:hypothetical protein
VWDLLPRMCLFLVAIAEISRRLLLLLPLPLLKWQVCMGGGNRTPGGCCVVSKHLSEVSPETWGAFTSCGIDGLSDQPRRELFHAGRSAAVVLHSVSTALPGHPASPYTCLASVCQLARCTAVCSRQVLAGEQLDDALSALSWWHRRLEMPHHHCIKI